jgi:hypothetical protein
VSVPPFTLDGYVATVCGLTDQGYSIASYFDHQPAQRHLILRHDIDQSIERARQMAACESFHGWRSTYFVLVRTEMYNAWSRAGASALREMSTAGHEIGLHLDATMYADTEELQLGAAAECRTLEDILGRPVRLISFHRPGRDLVGGDTLVAGRLHTYMDRFVRDIGYCSDSQGQWRHGHPWQHASVQEGRALHLLTHAVWWVGAEKQQPPRERLATILEERAQVVDRELRENNVQWR